MVVRTQMQVKMDILKWEWVSFDEGLTYYTIDDQEPVGLLVKLVMVDTDDNALLERHGNYTTEFVADTESGVISSEYSDILLKQIDKYFDTNFSSHIKVVD